MVTVARTPGGVGLGSDALFDTAGYTWKRDPRRNDRFTVTSPDGQRSYTVCTGNGFDTCNCPAFRRNGACKHLTAVQSALEQDPFADESAPDLEVQTRPEDRSVTHAALDADDHSALALRYACETALNTLYRMRITDLGWRRHADLRREVDGEVLPVLRDALGRARRNR